MTGSRWGALARHWAGVLTVVLASAILVSALVLRLSATLTADPDRSEANGDVRLTTDAAASQRALFIDAWTMKPGETIRTCMELRTATEGEQRQVAFDLQRAQPITDRLGDLLQVQISQGTGTVATGEFLADGTVSCRGFARQDLIFADSLRRINEQPAVAVWQPDAGISTTFFEFEVTLSPDAPNDLQGARVDGVDLSFVATTEPTDIVWVDRAGLLVTTLVRDRAAPIGGLALLALALASLQSLVTGSARSRTTGLEDDRDFEPPSLA